MAFKIAGIIPGRVTTPADFIPKKAKAKPLQCDECHCFVSLKDAYEEGDWDDVDRETYVYKLWLMTDCKNCGHRQGIEEVRA